LAVASALVVAASVTALAVPALADDSTGTVTGRFSDSGNAVAATVFIASTDFSYFHSTPTDSGGNYTFTDVPAGSYNVSFQLPSGFTQYAFGHLDPASADIITVSGGQTTTVDDSLVAHGSMSGHVTDSAGNPVANASVEANGVTDSVFAFTTTDATGAYTLPALSGGDYRVSFQASFNTPVQYANNRTSFDQADLIHVTNGAATVEDQSLLPTGTLSGTVTDSHGQPVSSAFLFASSPNGLFASGFTAPDGSYSISLFPDTYTLQIQLPNGLTQYAHNETDPGKADPLVVTANQVTVDNETTLPTGVVSGHLLDHDGNPVANASVSLDTGALSAFGSTDDTGAYSITAFAGTYSLRFDTSFGSEWAHNQSSASRADPIQVTADTTSTVDETLVATGSVSITASDSVTHAPISSFCAVLNGQVCTTDGTVTFPTVLPGRYTAFVSGPLGDDTYLESTIGGIVVSSAANTAATVALNKAAKVSAFVTDAKTGAPVANACLEVVSVIQPSQLGGGGGICSDATGHVSLDFVQPGTYVAFVDARDNVHGDQWVGPDGGVGAFKKAATITVTAGSTNTLPTVKLDKAGSISGTITDAATGKAPAFAQVSLSSINEGFGGGGFGVSADAQGHYTLSGLGPYQWTLFISGPGYASQFSGGVGDRDKATGVKVKANATTTFNVALSKGTTVTGKVFGPDGSTRSHSARVVFFNASTGDEMGVGDIFQSPFTYTAQVTGAQKVKIFYEGSVGDNYMGWVGGTDFASATVFSIPASGSKTFNVTMTQLSP
jgi:protocatechuate 3,4-dioxygenase beta subunit